MKHSPTLRTSILLSFSLQLLLSFTSYAQVERLKGFKTFNYFGGYDIGSITVLKEKYPDAPSFTPRTLDSRCFSKANFMLTSSVVIGDFSLKSSQKFKFNTSMLANNISNEVRAELSKIKNVSLKVSEGQRIFFKDGTQVAFREYASKLCKRELIEILNFIKENPKAFFISEIVVYSKATYEFNGTTSLSLDAQGVLNSAFKASGQWVSSNKMEINSPTSVYYKYVALSDYVPILESAKIALGETDCAYPDRGTIEASMPSKDYSLNPSLISGDNEFFGHGPKVEITFALRISDDKRSVLATLIMDAKELGGDGTHAYGKVTTTHYPAPDGYFIQSIPSEMTLYRGEDIDHDTDQGDDHIPASGPLFQVIYTGDMMGGDVGVPGGTGTFVRVRAINIRLTRCND